MGRVSLVSPLHLSTHQYHRTIEHNHVPTHPPYSYARTTISLRATTPRARITRCEPTTSIRHSRHKEGAFTASQGHLASVDM